MKIESIVIRSVRKSGFFAQHNDGEVHVKQLPFLSVVQATEGHYSFGKDEAPIKEMREGELFISTAADMQHIVHNTSSTTGTMTARWVFMDLYINGKRFDTLYSVEAIPEPKAQGELDSLMDELFRCDDICDEYSVCYKIVKVLLTLSTEKIKHISPLSATACQYIINHFNEPLNAEMIAAECCISKSRLFAVFKEDMGTSPIDYLNCYRLSYSYYLLMNTSRKLSDISSECGFTNPFYYSRLFKRQYGVSPSVMRER